MKNQRMDLIVLAALGLLSACGGSSGQADATTDAGHLIRLDSTQLDSGAAVERPQPADTLADQPRISGLGPDATMTEAGQDSGATFQDSLSSADLPVLFSDTPLGFDAGTDARSATDGMPDSRGAEAPSVDSPDSVTNRDALTPDIASGLSTERPAVQVVDLAPELGPEIAPELAPDSGRDFGSDSLPALLPDLGTDLPEPDATPFTDSSLSPDAESPAPDAVYDSPPTGYWVWDGWPDGNNHEYRLHYADRHFASVFVTNDKAGGMHSVVFRGHPGVDVNGWGASYHLGPFIAGADTANAIKPTVSAAASEGGITVVVAGSVNRTGGSYGTWNANLNFTFDGQAKTVTGGGTYNLALSGPLADAGADLNLGRVVSNYLTGVPLQCGGTGNTGDTSTITVEKGGGSGMTWDPTSTPSTCPMDSATDMAINLSGACNDVDTKVQRLTSPNSIAAAYKPSLRVELASQSGVGMIFCGNYNRGAADPTCNNIDFGQCPYDDNLGMEPIVTYSGKTITSLPFTLSISASAVSGDGKPNCCS